jgi:hypothetical protein
VIDSSGYAELVARAPFVFHRVWDCDSEIVDSILDHGLERVRTNYAGYWASRPRHVYMGTREKACRVKPNGVSTLMARRER